MVRVKALGRKILGLQFLLGHRKWKGKKYGWGAPKKGKKEKFGWGRRLGLEEGRVAEGNGNEKRKNLGGEGQGRRKGFGTEKNEKILVGHYKGLGRRTGCRGAATLRQADEALEREENHSVHSKSIGSSGSPVRSSIQRLLDSNGRTRPDL